MPALLRHWRRICRLTLRAHHTSPLLCYAAYARDGDGGVRQLDHKGLATSKRDKSVRRKRVRLLLCERRTRVAKMLLCMNYLVLRTRRGVEQHTLLLPPLGRQAGATTLFQRRLRVRRMAKPRIVRRAFMLVDTERRYCNGLL